jgi:superfamily II DNA or RNA helicase
MSERLLQLDDTPDRQDAPLELWFDEGTIRVDGFEGEAPEIQQLQYDDRVDGYRAKAVDYRALLGKLLKAGWAVRDSARDYEKLELELDDDKTPYEHQNEAMQAWKGADRRGVVVLPTGSGKTFVAKLAIDSIQRSTLVVVPTIDLMNQWSGQLEGAFGIDVGLIGGGYHEIEDVTVSTYDSAAMHMEHLGDQFGFVVFDEVHHLPSDFYRQAAEFSIAPFRLGLTATPDRSDGGHRDFPELTGPICYRQSISQLSGEVLAEYEVKQVEVGMVPEDKETYEAARQFYRSFVESRNIRMSTSNGWMRFLAATNRSEEGRKALRAYRTQKRLALINRAKMVKLFELLDEHRRDPVVIFTNHNETVYHISERRLVPAITHETDIKERKEILQKFNDGIYQTIVTSKVLNEGVDVPRAQIGIVVAGSGSTREHVQRLGRILRQWEGQTATLYELVTDDTVEQHVSERRRQHSAYE